MHRQVGGVVTWTTGRRLISTAHNDHRGTCARSLTGCVGDRRPHELLLARPSTLRVHVHADGTEAQQQLLAGDFHSAEGVQALLGDEGQGVVLWVEQADGGHVPVDAVDRTGVLGPSADSKDEEHLLKEHL